MGQLINWFVAHENVFVWASLVLNVCSTTVYIAAGNGPKAVYFGGAVLLTVGILLMR